MKKFTKFYSVLFLAALLSCQKSEEKLDPQSNKCLITQTDNYDGTKLSYTVNYEYDENKNLVKRTSKYTTGKIYIENYKNEYDSNKNLIKVTLTDQDSKLHSVIDYVYYSTGKVKTKTEQSHVYNKIKMTTEYNLEGKEIYYSGKSPNDNYERKTSYDSKNNMIFQESTQNGQLDLTVINTYNENNKIIKSIYKGGFNSTKEYTYDQTGKLVKTVDHTGLETTFISGSDKTIRESESKRNGVYVSSEKSEFTSEGNLIKTFFSHNKKDYSLIADYTYHTNSVPKTQKIYDFKKNSKTEVFMTYDVVYNEKGQALNVKIYDKDTYLISYSYENKFNCQ